MKKPLDKSVRDTAETIQGFGKISAADVRLDRAPRHDLQGVLDSHTTRQADYTRSGGSWDYKRINNWQDQIFGLHGQDPLADGGVMDKLEAETKELRVALEEYKVDPSPDNWDKVVKEHADILIMIVHSAGVTGVDIEPAVDSKMDINVARRWNVNDAGSGQHED